MSLPTVDELIHHLQLEPLPDEGGFYRQTFCCPETVPNITLGDAYPNDGERPFGTLIYYLITESGFSALHRLPTPEIWIWQMGDPAEMLFLPSTAESVKEPWLEILGPNIARGQQLQVVAPAHTWQGTRLLPGSIHQGYTLVSCMMSPGFAWSDFELGERNALQHQFPSWREPISARTRL
jgi:hypothetical protein